MPEHPNTPLVSVITPAWNAAATLQRAHDSVRMQSVRWQHVIVNDGSTDATAAIVKALAASDPRLLYAERPNGGPGAALNTGFDLAQGDYIAFLDADDEYRPKHLSSRLELLEANLDIDLLWGGMEIISSAGDDGLVPDVETGSGLKPVDQCVVQGTIFGRRKVFEALRFSEDRAVWYQDYDLVRRAKETFNVQRTDFKTYRYYRNSGSSLVDRVKAAWA